MKGTVLLIEISNTNTTFAFAAGRRLSRLIEVPTAQILRGKRLPVPLRGVRGVGLSSVVPAATKRILPLLPVRPVIVSARLDLGIGVRYPHPQQIGADRLCNAVGVVALYGTPAIVVDFGTAVTFDIVNAHRDYIGGVIAPGLAAMTHYLHERTALLPYIRLREPQSLIGRSTVEAMQIGAVVGYRGMVKEILAGLRRQPALRQAVVVATGGYGRLIARHVPAIAHVNPRLTLIGLRLIYERNEPH